MNKTQPGGCKRILQITNADLGIIQGLGDMRFPVTGKGSGQV